MTCVAIALVVALPVLAFSLFLAYVSDRRLRRLREYTRGLLAAFDELAAEADANAYDVPMLRAAHEQLRRFVYEVERPHQLHIWRRPVNWPPPNAPR